LILGIDFDGVVHDYKNPIKGRRMGLPIAGARSALVKYKLHGHRIIIFSTWADERGKKIIADWMRYFTIPYDDITNLKPEADCYLDDKAIRFTTWSDFETEVPA
jgi:hypothetical protein